MRSVPVAILLSTAVLLAGCSGGDGEDDLHYTCPGGMEVHGEDHPDANTTTDLAKHCPGATTSGSRSSSTSQAPNVLPTLVLTITDDNGTETPVTMLDGNLTFDATGSTDSDGAIAGIAVTVTDSNTTRTATLYDAGKKQFKPATFRFDRPGVVNVTVAMVDDRAGFTVNQTHVYVNQVVQSPPSSITFPRPAAGFTDCGGGEGVGGQGGDLTEAQFYKEFSFPLFAGATMIEATDAEGVLLSICSPADEALSGAPSNPAVTAPGTALPAPAGVESYYVAAYLEAPAADTAVGPVITIHYEPQDAAAA